MPKTDHSLINSGATRSTRPGNNGKGQTGQETVLESRKEVEDCLAATRWCPANRDYFRGGGTLPISSRKEGCPYHVRLTWKRCTVRCCKIAEYGTVRTIRRFIKRSRSTDQTWPTPGSSPSLTSKPASRMSTRKEPGESNHGALSSDTSDGT